MVIETCPKCGHDLVNEIICTYPPIPVKHCYHCGWHWEGEKEEVVRVPFHENQGEIVNDDSTLSCLTYVDIGNISVDNIESSNICINTSGSVDGTVDISYEDLYKNANILKLLKK